MPPELVILVAGPAGGGAREVAALLAPALPVWPLGAALAGEPQAGLPVFVPDKEGPETWLARAVFEADLDTPRAVLWADHPDLARWELDDFFGERDRLGGFALVRVSGNPLAAALRAGERVGHRPAQVARLAHLAQAGPAWDRRLAGWTRDRLDLVAPDHLGDTARARLAAFLDLDRLAGPKCLPTDPACPPLRDRVDLPELVARRLPGAARKLFEEALDERDCGCDDPGA